MKLIYRIVDVLQYFAKVQIRVVILAVSSFLLLGSNIQLMAAESDLNQTQKGINNVINQVIGGSRTCGNNGGNDYDRICSPLLSEVSDPDPDQTSAIQIGSPEQTGSSGTNANKTSSNQTSSSNQTILNRMTFLRSGSVASNGSGVQFYDNGKPIDQNSYAGHATTNMGAASADEYSKLGLWVNGIFRFGNVDETFQAPKGYDYNNLGVTLGLDYAITQDFIMGAAFTYLSTSGDYTNDGGDFNTDLFNGAIYASYYITDDFYIDGLAFYGGNNYNITRNVSYTVPNVVNETLLGTPDGKQYGFNITSGYGFNFQRLVVEPYVSIGYIGTDIDAYEETGVGISNGWAQRYDAQNLVSVKSTLGALFAYNFDVPWGVLVPQIRGEWHHEFEDDGRNITSSFVGNEAAGQNGAFSIAIENPDRDYFTFGTSLTSAFNYGITAFLAYDMLIGYNNVNSYGFTLGGRMDF